MSQLYFPNEPWYNGEINRARLQDTVRDDYYKSHLSMKPLMDKHITQPDTILSTDRKCYYWLTQKLFKENFIVFKGKGFWCSLDPILDLEGGFDFVPDSLPVMYWNTRGLRVQAKFLDRVAFNTVIYETQIVQPQFISDYISKHGEFYTNASDTYYFQDNGVVPGYARTKDFKETGYDFGMAEGQLSVYANKHLNFQLGNGSMFIGSGHRSLLLSDFTPNYPFFKTQLHALKGRLQYSVTYALHQNLYRLTDHSTPESIYERKFGTYQYLDFSVTKNWQIGLFHGSMWNRVDSLGVQKPDYAFLNPIIFSNLIFKGMESEENKSVIGLNTSYSLGPATIYGQIVVGEKLIGGYQIGVQAYDLLAPNLDFRVEYNHAERNTYLAENQRMNYSHSNLPLAHPLVAGFDELVFDVGYQRKMFYIKNHLVYSARTLNDSTNIGVHILDPKVVAEQPHTFTNHVIYNQLETGLRINKRYNLQLFIGHVWRNETRKVSQWLTNYTYGGIRCSLRNKTFDF